MNEENFFLAIVKDDVNSFDKAVLSYGLNFSFGRFPILSLCYLYKSKKILKMYEMQLLKIHTFKKINNEYGAYPLFRKKAQRVIRLYAAKDRYIMPLEMLLILGKKRRIEKVYEIAYKDNSTFENLQCIQTIKSGEKVEARGRGISVPRSPLSYETKLQIKKLIALCSIILIVLGASLASIFSYAYDLKNNAQYIYSENSFINALSKDKKISLKKDITINSTIDNFSGVINGNGHTITIEKPLFKELSGLIMNAKIVFKKSENINSDYAVIAINNKGRIRDLKIDINSNVDYSLEEEGKVVYFSPVCAVNDGIISNVVIQGDILLNGNGKCDASVASISCKNNGNIKDSVSYVNIKAKVCDVGGICIENFGTIENTSNCGVIEQNSLEAAWSPYIAGISVKNYGTIIECKNFGDIAVKSSRNEKTYMYAGGIACINHANISQSLNVASITSDCGYGEIYMGGIAAFNREYTDEALECEFKINECSSEGEFILYNKVENSVAYIGGVISINDGPLFNSYSLMDIDFKDNINSLAAGIVAHLTLFSNISLNAYFANNAFLKTENFIYSFTYENLFTRYGALDVEGVSKHYDTREELLNNFNNNR